MSRMTTNVHGVFDYLFGALLVAMPWVLGHTAIGGPETWIPMIVGAGVIIYSLLTDYEWGLVGLIDVRAHLVLDVVAGVTLLASLLFFGFFDGTVWTPYVVVGAVAIIGGLATEPGARSRRPRLRLYRGARQ